MAGYKIYKESIIPWIGQIPAHWETRRAKYMFKKEKRDVRPEDRVITCFRDGQVTLRENRRTTGFTESITEVGYQGIRKGDLVIHQMDAFAGSIGVSDSDGKGTSVYHCCTPTGPYIPQYYAYALREMARAGFIQSLYRGIRERSSDFNFFTFGRQFLPVPPIEEQEKIVAFLDKQITLIESCKCQRERELQTLNELKQAEIASVVTRGLNPNAPMKESGQIQFGEIPAHWDSVKMKYCFTQRSEKGFPDEPVLCATQSKGVIPQSLYENRVVVVNKGFDGLKLVKVGDFVISLRSFQGGIEYAYYQGIISAAYTILTPKDVRNAQYFKYLFKSHPFIQLLQTCVTGIREGQNINYAILGNNFIPIPPIEEQNAIVEYIEAKTNKIDTMIDALKAEIDRLTEYKQRLISDVVTGQMNVQDETA